MVPSKAKLVITQNAVFA